MSSLFKRTAPTKIYTLSLHDALPISFRRERACPQTCGPSAGAYARRPRPGLPAEGLADRKSTRLNSSHANLVCRLLLEKKNCGSDLLAAVLYQQDRNDALLHHDDAHH